MLRQRLAMFAAALALCTVYGCSGEKKVVDVETPIGEVEVLEDESNGDVSVTVDTPAEEE